MHSIEKVISMDVRKERKMDQKIYVKFFAVSRSPEPKKNGFWNVCLSVICTSQTCGLILKKFYILAILRHFSFLFLLQKLKIGFKYFDQTLLK